MRSEGSKNLSAPKIIKQITAQNTPTAPIIADFPLLFLIKSIKITTKGQSLKNLYP